MHEQVKRHRPPYVVGLDLSLTASGVAVLGLESGRTQLELVKTAAAGDSLTAAVNRAQTATERILRLLPPHGLVVVEAPSHGSQFGKAHERAGLWWLIVTRLHQRGFLYAQVAPRTRSKYAAGHRPVAKPRSGPSKQEVVAAGRAEFPYLELRNDNLADAFALARMGARFLGAPIDPSTRQRDEAVAAVRWPAIPEGMNK